MSGLVLVMANLKARKLGGIIFIYIYINIKFIIIL